MGGVWTNSVYENLDYVEVEIIEPVKIPEPEPEQEKIEPSPETIIYEP